MFLFLKLICLRITLWFFSNILFHNCPSSTFQNKAILFTHPYSYHSLPVVKSLKCQTKEHFKTLILAETPLRKSPWSSSKLCIFLCLPAILPKVKPEIRKLLEPMWVCSEFSVDWSGWQRWHFCLKSFFPPVTQLLSKPCCLESQESKAKNIVRNTKDGTTVFHPVHMSWDISMPYTSISFGNRIFKIYENHFQFLH